MNEMVGERRIVKEDERRRELKRILERNVKEWDEKGGRERRDWERRTEEEEKIRV
jgi:hypothetical protein